MVAWDYPLMHVASDLNPEALRRPQAKNKVCSDKEFVDAVITTEGKSFSKIVAWGSPVQCTGLAEPLT